MTRRVNCSCPFVNGASGGIGGRPGDQVVTGDMPAVRHLPTFLSKFASASVTAVSSGD
jgi:hypothetical protein